MRILLTGAGGFVGSRLLIRLKEMGHYVRALDRQDHQHLNKADEKIVAPLSPSSDHVSLVDGMDVLVHLADGYNAYEHLPFTAMHEEAEERLRTSRALVNAAAAHGCSIIYLSTIKTMCGTFAEDVLTEQTPPRPQSLYGLLKLETERIIHSASEHYKCRSVCLRFPIVFGPGAGGNMNRLLRLADTPWPLPFAGLENRRSLISSDSLVDAVCQIIDLYDKPGGIYLVHDGAVTVSELFCLMRKGLGRPTRLFSLPRFARAMVEQLPGLRAYATRFFQPLQLNDQHFRRTYDWAPRKSLQESILDWAQAARCANQA